jgi:hypothetical protein
VKYNIRMRERERSAREVKKKNTKKGEERKKTKK